MPNSLRQSSAPFFRNPPAWYLATMTMLYLTGSVPFAWIGYECIRVGEIWQALFCGVALIFGLRLFSIYLGRTNSKRRSDSAL
jgi:hypothetical protein